jgi:predicted double-glycine peptidase
MRCHAGRKVYPIVVCVLAIACTQASAGMVSLSGGQYAVPVASLQELRFRHVVQQQYDFSCGSAALATLLTYHYGQWVDEHKVFMAMYQVGDQEKIRRQGFSLLDMKRYLRSFGYTANGFRVSLEQVRQAGLAGIALVTLNGYRHFVVVKGVTESEVLIGDPALGLRTIPRGRFQDAWSGIIFVIHDGARPLPTSFNSPAEWALHPEPPFTAGLSQASLASFTLALPQQRDL